MSKMSRLNLQLQEQAEELGFSTLQEALEAGYEVSFKNAELVGPLEQAHEAWLREKQILIHEVEMLINDTPYQVYKDTLRKVVKFLEGVKHE